MNDNEKKIKYSVIKAFMQPFWIISENLKEFFIQGNYFSLLILTISYLLGQKYICFFNEHMAVNMYCPNLPYLYFVYLLIKLIAISACIKIWYDTIFKKECVNREYFKNKWKTILKIFLVIIAFSLLNFMPVISGLILFFRVPNPIWQIELMFFTVVSVGFLVPFILMRLYIYIINFFEGNKINTIKQIWNITSGYSMKIVWSSVLVFFMFLILLIVAKGFFSRYVNMPAEIYNFVAEYVMAFVNYFIIIVFVNFIQIQKQIFLGDK